MNVVLIGTTASSMLNFRTDLIVDMVGKGYEVHCFCTDHDTVSREKLYSLGAKPVDYSLSRAGVNIFADIRAIIQIRSILLDIKPDVVFSFFVKPVIYGSIAARLAYVGKRYGMLEGLGYVFTELPKGPTFKQNMLQRVQVLLYRLALPHIDKLIFLNHDDPVDLLDNNNLRVKSKEVLGGIGLNMESYKYSTPVISPVRFLFIGRLLIEKGIHEFVNAARIMKSRYPDTEFIILGGMDEENPGGLSRVQIADLLEEGIITYPGHVNNVKEWIKDSSVFVLPSYREGFPLSTQEAMAIGRAIITTDVPGCRESVFTGVNGYVVPRWDVNALVDKMSYFVDNPSEIVQMGKASRRLAVEMFDSKQVNSRLLSMLDID